jgi:hypothetical protein
MVWLQATNKAQVFVLARLIRAEITPGEDATPTYIQAAGVLWSFDLVGCRTCVTRSPQFLNSKLYIWKPKNLNKNHLHYIKSFRIGQINDMCHKI